MARSQDHRRGFNDGWDACDVHLQRLWGLADALLDVLCEHDERRNGLPLPVQEKAEALWAEVHKSTKHPWPK